MVIVTFIKNERDTYSKNLHPLAIFNAIFLIIVRKYDRRTWTCYIPTYYNSPFSVRVPRCVEINRMFVRVSA